MRGVTITLAPEQATLLLEALDAAEYWAWGVHGDPELPVDNGYVYLPGDYVGDADPYWPEEPDEDEQEAIRQVRVLREITDLVSTSLAKTTSLNRLRDVTGATDDDIERIQSFNAMKYGNSDLEMATREAITEALESIESSLSDLLEEGREDPKELATLMGALAEARRLLKDDADLRGADCRLIAEARDLVA